MASNTAKPAELGDNAFPKISGKAKDFLRRLQDLKDGGKLPAGTIDMEGTVKLHGMHADIVFDLQAPDSNEAAITFQSRNRICDLDSSQHGWPINIAEHTSALHDLKNQVLNRYADRDSTTFLDTTKPLIIAGEYIGPKVQKDVAVSELPPHFVILSVQINGVWQQDSHYADIEALGANIINVQRVPPYVVKFDPSNLTLSNPALHEMQRLADEVEAECPFAASFGIKGRGEGIVWKLGTPEGMASARYWLKTKGPQFGPENRIKPISAADEKAKDDIDAAAAAWVSERRIEQAFEYLAEMGTPEQARKTTFINWIRADILKEEATEIEQMKKKIPGVEKTLKQKLGGLAGAAFFRAHRQ